MKSSVTTGLGTRCCHCRRQLVQALTRSLTRSNWPLAGRGRSRHAGAAIRDGGSHTGLQCDNRAGDPLLPLPPAAGTGADSKPHSQQLAAGWSWAEPAMLGRQSGMAAVLLLGRGLWWNRCCRWCGCGCATYNGSRKAFYTRDVHGRYGSSEPMDRTQRTQSPQ